MRVLCSNEGNATSIFFDDFFFLRFVKLFSYFNFYFLLLKVHKTALFEVAFLFVQFFFVVFCFFLFFCIFFPLAIWSCIHAMRQGAIHLFKTCPHNPLPIIPTFQAPFPSKRAHYGIPYFFSGPWNKKTPPFNGSSLNNKVHISFTEQCRRVSCCS